MSEEKTENKKQEYPDYGAGWKRKTEKDSFISASLKITGTLAKRLLKAAEASEVGEATLNFSIWKNKYKQEGTKQPDVRFIGDNESPEYPAVRSVVARN